jgi:ABC-type transport system involved in multi-copper enzyme maturation permease subunit
MFSLLRLLALGLWVGAMIGFAFIFAPIAFATIGPTPAFAATIARVVGAVTVFGYACALIAVLASVALFGSQSRRSIAIVTLVVIMSALGLYETHAIVPLMQSTPLQTPAYDALHRRSSAVYSAILLCGLAAFVMSAWPTRPSTGSG